MRLDEPGLEECQLSLLEASWVSISKRSCCIKGFLRGFSKVYGSGPTWRFRGSFRWGDKQGNYKYTHCRGLLTQLTYYCQVEPLQVRLESEPARPL